jgi:5-formyltetrahydrofolate cyclo-ligase
LKAALNRDKKSIRKEILGRRDSLSREEKAEKDAAIRERFLSLPEFRDAKAILFFASFRSEVDTFHLIGRALKEGKRALLPKVEGDRLEIHEIFGLDELERGFMGIPEPTAGARKADINAADLVIMPGAAFDLSGGRLGYGKGYYDRMLAGLKKPVPLVALAYELQVVEGTLPSEPHDIRVNRIVSEKRVISCRG